MTQPHASPRSSSPFPHAPGALRRSRFRPRLCGLLLLAAGCGTPLTFQQALESGDLEALDSALSRGAQIDQLLDNEDTALHYAARRGDLPLMRSLLSDGASQTSRTPFGETPLFVAARADQAAAIALLAGAGSDPNARSEEGRTPLGIAFEKRAPESFGALLKAGADPDAPHAGGGPLVVQAAGLEDERFLVALLATVADLDARDSSGATALARAFEHHPRAAALLLDAGAGADVAVNGQPPLLLALAAGDTSGVRALLRSGADPAAADSTGTAVLLFAAHNGLTDSVLQLLDAGAPTTALDSNAQAVLHIAASKGDQGLVMNLLRRGVAPDGPEPERSRRTPLSYAAIEGHAGIARALLDAGAEIDRLSVDGRSPLILAGLNRNPELTELLLERDARTETRGPDGFTALDSAAYRGDLRSVEALLSHLTLARPGAGVDGSDTGCTPLFLAGKGGHTEVVASLLRAGADPFCANALGETPLHSAANSGRPELARLLLEAGAPLDVEDRNGWTPLGFAAGLGHLELLDLFVESGAEIDFESSQGRTALDQALLFEDAASARRLHELGASVPDPEAFEAQLVRIGPQADALMESLRMALARNPVGNFVTFGGQPDSPAEDVRRRYAVHRAEHLVTVLALLEEGAGPDARRFTGNGVPKTAAEVTGYREARSSFSLGTIEGLPLEVVPGFKGQGITALMLAAQEADVQIVLALLEAGADPNISDDYGWTARMYLRNAASLNNQMDLIEPSNDHRAQIDALLIAAGATR